MTLIVIQNCVSLMQEIAMMRRSVFLLINARLSVSGVNLGMANVIRIV